MGKKILKPSIPKGMRDFLPSQKRKRDYVFKIIKDIFEKFGYQPLETSSIEKEEILTGKYGEEGERLIFKILKRGTELEKLGKELKEFTINSCSQLTDLALRYDLSIPLSRVIAMYENELSFPFKRYQIQPVWRADKPQKGRYREFYQCDADIIGSDSVMADAEIILIINEIMTKLKFKKFVIKINNRKILNGLIEYCGIPDEKAENVFISLDKLDKIGIEGVITELKNRSIEDKQIQKLLSLLRINGNNKTILQKISKELENSKSGIEGANELKELLYFLELFNVPEKNIEIDLSLARGLEYYTGIIYESTVREPRIGSLTGGGRYDKLIGIFSGKDIPATGTSIGIERIIDVMSELNMLPEIKNDTKVLVTIFSSEYLKKSIDTVSKIREAGIKTELYIDYNQKIKKQFKYANNNNIPFVIVLGPEEVKLEHIALKNMSSGEQMNISEKEFFKDPEKYLN